MNENTRVLPRYKTQRMKIQISLEDNQGIDFRVEDLSLGGIKLSCNKLVDILSPVNMLIKLGRQEFKLLGQSVWNKRNSDEDKYSYGFRLEFSKEEQYRRWATFMKALHGYKNK